MSAPDVFLEDTIVAAATPPGTGAIALLRLSGPDALPILERLLETPAHLRHGRARRLRVDGLDDFLVTPYLAPRSYTGEDTVEISCHGNPLIVERFLLRLTAAGARAAGPGEFTYRAVRNGKMTVTEAERLAHRLHARLPWELELAETGKPAAEAFSELLAQVHRAMADLESAIEFQEGEGPDWEALADRIRRIAVAARLQDHWARLPRVLLLGAVNAGKSTLFNRIAGYDRAIVSDQPGTTRDWLETEIRHEGILFQLIDSAGLRPQAGGLQAADGPEAEGMRHTLELARDADVIVAFSEAPELVDDARTIAVQGKADEAGSCLDGRLPVSGRTGAGVQELLRRIVECVRTRRTAERPEWWFSVRLSVLAQELETAFGKLQAEPLAEVRALHLQRLARRLEDQLEVPPADLYGLILSRFCIGK
jgi:tRNA modification GTPase